MFPPAFKFADSEFIQTEITLRGSFKLNGSILVGNQFQVHSRAHSESVEARRRGRGGTAVGTYDKKLFLFEYLHFK